MPVIMFIEGFVEECIVVKEGRRLAVRYTGIIIFNTEINKGTFDVWLKSSSRRKYKETPNSARNMVESRRRTHREGNNRSKFQNTSPMICLCNIYPYQNTLLEYKTNKRVGFQNNFKMRHDMMNHLDYILFII